MPGPAPNFIWRKLTTPAWLEGHADRLNHATAGRHAIVERPGRTRLAVEFFCRTRAAAERLAAEVGGTIEELPRDWEAQLFTAHKTRPLRIGRRLIVAGAEEDLPHGAPAATLIIPAGAAFGTGEHATTAMSLRLLERQTRRRPPGWRMLDAGTGSGVLALAAKCFGAGAVLALDHDRTAIATVRENARRNVIRGVQFVVADVRKLSSDGPFDLIAANLYSELLEELLPRFRHDLAPDGQLILSGVLRVQEAKLTRALRRNDFRLREARRRGKWVALLCTGSRQKPC